MNVYQVQQPKDQQTYAVAACHRCRDETPYVVAGALLVGLVLMILAGALWAKMGRAR